MPSYDKEEYRLSDYGKKKLIRQRFFFDLIREACKKRLEELMYEHQDKDFKELWELILSHFGEHAIPLKKNYGLLEIEFGLKRVRSKEYFASYRDSEKLIASRAEQRKCFTNASETGKIYNELKAEKSKPKAKKKDKSHD